MVVAVAVPVTTELFTAAAAALTQHLFTTASYRETSDELVEDACEMCVTAKRVPRKIDEHAVSMINNRDALYIDTAVWYHHCIVHRLLLH